MLFKKIWGDQFGEMRTMMQYLFQNFNFRGKAKMYQDLIKSKELKTKPYREKRKIESK